MSRTGLIAAICGVMMASSVAHASLYFSPADFQSMTATPTTGFTGSGVMTAAPNFGDGQTNMTGFYGATGNLNPNFGGVGVTVYYAVNASSLSSLNTQLGTNSDTLNTVAHNDNNQPWAIGIWYQTAAGLFEVFETIAPKNGNPVPPSWTDDLSILIPANTTLLGAGVAVRSVIGTNSDDFHASFSVPEASTIAVWSMLSFIGAGIAYRKRMVKA